MIYDCCLFFQENDLFELRYNVLKDVVDRFVVVELNRTHRGDEKPPYFEHKDKPNVDYHFLHAPDITGWPLENWHRRQIRNCLPSLLQPRDLVLISDVDEIPNPEKIFPDNVRYVQEHYYFFLDTSVEVPWRSGTYSLLGRHIDPDFDFQVLRTLGHRGQDRLIPVDDGGWHFSSVATKEDLVKKLSSFAHDEFELEKVLENRDNMNDIHGGSMQWKSIEERALPEYLKANKHKYRHLCFSI